MSADGVEVSLRSSMVVAAYARSFLCSQADGARRGPGRTTCAAGPFARLTRYPEFSTPAVVIWSMRWLLFRVMIGAGLIKLRSNDNCWKDLTCMNHHYETQPVPNPLSFFLHKAPESWHLAISISII